MDIAQFQQLIRDRYYETDSARGPAATFLWLTEEFGELAEALAKRERGDDVQSELEGESMRVDYPAQLLIQLGCHGWLLS